MTDGFSRTGHCAPPRELPIGIYSIGKPKKPALRSLDAPLRLGRYGCFATFYACKVGESMQAWSDLEQKLGEMAQQRSCPGETVWGVSTLPAHGVVVRGLGCTQRTLAAGLPSFWSAARRFLFGEDGILPRKLY